MANNVFSSHNFGSEIHPYIILEGKFRNFFGSLYIIKVKEDVGHTSIVEFTQLITNTTETVALNYDTQIIQKMKNFTMTPTFQDILNAGGCEVGSSCTAFETTEFFDRNIFKSMSLE